jgi:hypothetical protein
MELGAGLVDTLRLGSGVAQGGLKGIGTDALRVVAMAGPLAKGSAMFGRFVTPVLRVGTQPTPNLSGVEILTLSALGNPLVRRTDARGLHGVDQQAHVCARSKPARE